MRRLLAVAAVALVVVAGCVSPTGFDPGTTGVEGGSAAGGDTTGGTPVDSGGGSVDGDADGSTATPGGNPWGERIVVGLVDGTGNDRDYAPMVREAAAFWEDTAERYAGFPVDYEVDPGAAEPDIVLRFVREVPECDGKTDAAGCAPVITDSRQIDRPEDVYVKSGLSFNSTVLVAKHELGHTLGLGHDDGPADVMAARSVLYTEPRPDAVDRAFPWADGDFTVRIDAENASDPAGAQSQVDHALAYYEDDPPGMPTNLTFTRTDAEPEIHVRFGPTSDCGASSGSCIATYGTDPDGDGAIETYTRVEITLVGLDTEAVGWHVGYWLAHAFGAEADGEKPPPFRDASGRDRRSAWWE